MTSKRGGLLEETAATRHAAQRATSTGQTASRAGGRSGRVPRRRAQAGSRLVRTRRSRSPSATPRQPSELVRCRQRTPDPLREDSPTCTVARSLCRRCGSRAVRLHWLLARRAPPPQHCSPSAGVPTDASSHLPRQAGLDRRPPRRVSAVLDRAPPRSHRPVRRAFTPSPVRERSPRSYPTPSTRTSSARCSPLHPRPPVTDRSALDGSLASAQVTGSRSAAIAPHDRQLVRDHERSSHRPIAQRKLAPPDRERAVPITLEPCGASSRLDRASQRSPFRETAQLR